MADNKFSNILVTRDEGYALITLNRPHKMNPLDIETVRELRSAVEELDGVSGLRAVVFTGAGRAFSAGGDLERYLTLFKKPDEFRDFEESFYKLFEFMERSAKIYVAAINGVCVAGGFELLLACDMVIAAENAKIGDGHVNFCQLPGAGSSARAWRAMGSVRAKHLLLTGDLLSAREAERLGLVGEVTAEGELEAGIKKLVAKLQAKSPAALRGMKFLLNEAIRSDLERALRTEIAYVHQYATTEPDVIEGLLAFKEKRKPKYASD